MARAYRPAVAHPLAAGTSCCPTVLLSHRPTFVPCGRTSSAATPSACRPTVPIGPPSHLAAPQAKAALTRMVAGDNMHVEVSMVETNYALTPFSQRESHHSLRAREAISARLATRRRAGGDGDGDDVEAAEGGGAVATRSKPSAGRHQAGTASQRPDAAAQADKATRARGGGERALFVGACHHLVLLIERMLSLCLRMRLGSRRGKRKLRTQRAVSGDRFVQMCEDLTTVCATPRSTTPRPSPRLTHFASRTCPVAPSLRSPCRSPDRRSDAPMPRCAQVRWSWNDYILIHEIVSRPAASAQPEASPTIVLDYASPQGSKMRLRLVFTSSEVHQAWLLGLQVSVASAAWHPDPA